MYDGPGVKEKKKIKRPSFGEGGLCSDSHKLIGSGCDNKKVYIIFSAQNSRDNSLLCSLQRTVDKIFFLIFSQ